MAGEPERITATHESRPERVVFERRVGAELIAQIVVAGNPAKIAWRTLLSIFERRPS